MKKVPFVDLHAQYLSIKDEIDNAIEKVIKESAYIKGRYVDEFEVCFAEKLGMKHCIGVANGTDALFIAMKMLGIGPGDEVITTSLSWISTAETISLTGANPVFVDIEEDFYTIDPNKIESVITKNTKAVIPVHLYGQMCDMSRIVEICRKYNLLLIEDCAQSHFSSYNNQLAGTFGDIATFSFYPGKNLGAYGDAGAIVTNNDELANKFRMYANHGALKKHYHLIEGVNSRLDGLQAAILCVKLKYIDQWNVSRQKIAEKYRNNLQNIPGLILPVLKDNVVHTFHLFVIRSFYRKKLIELLTENNIETAIHYPTPLPFMVPYEHLIKSNNRFPVTSKISHEIISLPLYPELPTENVNYICDIIREFYYNK